VREQAKAALGRNPPEVAAIAVMTYVPDRVGIAIWVPSGDHTGGPPTPISAQPPRPADAGRTRLPIGVISLIRPQAPR